MRKLARTGIFTLLLAALLVSGCEKKQEAVPEAKPAPEKKASTRVVVPDFVQGKWRAVKVAIHDNKNDRNDIYTIDIYSSLSIPDSDLVLTIENFLPSFQMDGMTLTSTSNRPENPAAQISITEKGQEIFRGWLFTLYPNTHAFQHPRFSLNLVGSVPAE